MLLVDNEEGSTLARFLHDQLWAASVRFADTPVLGESATWLRSIPGRRPSETDQSVLVTPAPENALPDVAVNFRPDIVVGSRLARPTWRTIQQTCASMHIPTALYMHAESALHHLNRRKGQPFFRADLVLANSRSLVTSARAFRTVAHFIPSVVDLQAARVDSTRERVLLVNPRRDHGVEVVEELASHFRTTEFVLQESWPLSSDERDVVDAILSRQPNVCFRPRVSSPAEVFRDASIVLAPHRVDHRPRVIREALANGIPVVANNLPSLVESVGPGGLIATDQNEWFDAINMLCQDPVTYRRYQHAALQHANRAEVQDDQIVHAFLTHIQSAIGHRRSQPIDIDLT